MNNVYSLDYLLAFIIRQRRFRLTIQVYIYVYTSFVDGRRKGKKFSRQVFVSDARHMTIIWVLTELATHELGMTDEVKSKVN
jgi:hypothetical protein